MQGMWGKSLQLWGAHPGQAGGQQLLSGRGSGEARLFTWAAVGKQVGKSPAGSQNVHHPADSQQLLLLMVL